MVLCKLPWNFRRRSSSNSRCLPDEEGATAGDLIRRIVEDHVARNEPAVRRTLNVSLPLIAASETGPVRAITGEDVDELLSDDRLPA